MFTYELKHPVILLVNTTEQTEEKYKKILTCWTSGWGIVECPRLLFFTYVTLHACSLFLMLIIGPQYVIFILSRTRNQRLLENQPELVVFSCSLVSIRKEEGIVIYLIVSSSLVL